MFPRDAVAKLLADVHRRCCICHRYCGAKMETDHIVPRSEGGLDDIENAIAVCFECHAEIHAYNNQHPRGRKFTPDELQLHKTQWLKVCQENPAALVPSGALDSDVGPIQALIDELEYNDVVAKRNKDFRVENGRGAEFIDDQFRRAIRLGAISLLDEALKSQILEAYAAMNRANKAVAAEFQEHVVNYGRGHLRDLAEKGVNEATPLITSALRSLFEHLGIKDGQRDQ